MPLGNFRLLRFPGGLLLFQHPTLGIQLGLLGRKMLGFHGLGGRGFIALDSHWRRSSANAHSRGFKFRTKPLQFGLVRRVPSAISAFCVSQAVCCSSSARRWASNSACWAARCSASVDCEVKASSRWELPLTTFLGQVRHGLNQSRAQGLQFGRAAARSACDWAFCDSHSVWSASNAWQRASRFRLPGGQLFRFGRPTDGPLVVVRFPLLALFFQRSTLATGSPRRAIPVPRARSANCCRVSAFKASLAACCCSKANFCRSNSACRPPIARPWPCGRFRSGSVRPPMPDARRPARRCEYCNSALLFVQRTKAGLDLGQLLVDRSLLVAQVLAGQARLRGFNHFQVDGADAQTIARLQHRLGEISAVQPRVGRPSPNHRPAGAAENQAMDRPHIVSSQSQRTIRARSNRALGRLQAHDLAIAGRSPHAQDQKTGSG